MTAWLLERVEDGFVNWMNLSSSIAVSGSGSGVMTAYHGVNYDQKTENNSVFVVAEKAEQIEYGSNIWNVGLNIIHKYCPEVESEINLNERNSAIKKLTEAIYNNQNLYSNIETNTNGLKIYDIESGNTLNTTDGTNWINVQEFNVVCCIFNT